jgi:hypothetical protein
MRTSKTTRPYCSNTTNPPPAPRAVSGLNPPGRPAPTPPPPRRRGGGGAIERMLHELPLPDQTYKRLVITANALLRTTAPQEAA